MPSKDKNRSLPLVSILIATHNDENTIRMTLDCLEAGIMYYENRGGMGEVVLVDDGSSDATSAIADQWKASKLNLRCVIIHQENAGITQSLSRAFDFVSSHSDFIFRIDGDAFFIKEDWIFKVVDFMSIHPDIGGVAPCVLFPDGKVQACGVDYFSEDADRSSVYMGQGLSYEQLPQRTSPIEVDAFSGTCACYRKKYWSIDQNYYLWTEDQDQSLTVRKMGGKNFILPFLTLYHAGKGFARGSRYHTGDLENVHTRKEYLRASIGAAMAAVIGIRRWIQYASWFRSKGLWHINAVRRNQEMLEKNLKYFSSKWGFTENSIDCELVKNKYKGTELLWRWNIKSQNITNQILKKYDKMKKIEKKGR